MTEQWTASQQTEMRTPPNKLTAPTLFLSSKGAGWEGLTVCAYHEPMEMEEWIDPAGPDTALILLTSGTMLIEHRRGNGSWKTQPIRQGDMMLRPAGASTNGLRWRSLSADPMQTLHIHLSNALFSRTVEELADRDSTHLVVRGRIGFQDPLLMQVGLALRRELEQPTTAGKLYAQAAAQMLTVHLLRHYASPASQIKEHSQGLTQRQISRVTDFILAHLNQDLSLSVLAEQLGFSAYHFARLFRRATGESPHQFVLRQRIEHAKHLLKDADLPLAHIALESGFANQSHMTQTFKHHFGLTPAAYRKDHTIRHVFSMNRKNL